MKNQLQRRHFLRGAGALIALPALESIGFRRFASAASKAAGVIPKRAVFMGIGFGVTKQTWYPELQETGKDYKLTEGSESVSSAQVGFYNCARLCQSVLQRSTLG